MTARSSIRSRFARTRRTLRRTPAWCQPSPEALEDRTLLSVNFSPAVSYGVGFSPYSVAVGDFNGDGKQDLVTANAGASSVSVQLGNGDGTFASPVSFGVGVLPESVAVGDFNGDGKPDVVTANTSSSNSVSVLINNGDGTFASAVNYGVGSAPQSVAVGDFNGDGKQDLVTANTGSNSISVLLNNGNGTFANAVSYGVGSAPEAVTVGDFNRDGKPDLAVVNTRTSFQGVLGNSVSVLLNNGNGTFANAVSVGSAGTGTGIDVASVAVGDFNGDGKPDLAVAAFNNNGVFVLLGNGNGTFTANAGYFAGSGPSSVTVGDFNGDGKPDLAVADQSGNSVSVLVNNGNGAGVLFDDPASFFSGAGPYSVAAGDFNGDGKQDLVAADQLSSRVSVLLNNTAPTISSNMAAVTANEGSPASNTGTFADAQGRGTVTLSASVGTVTQNNTTGAWSWRYTPPDGPASSTVTITAVDTGGLIASTSFTLNVLNVAPTITAFSVPSSGAEGSPVNLSASATDPAGVNDPLTYTWTIARPDGSTFATLAGAQASFTPPDNGNYGVSLVVSDGDGGTASRSAAPVGLVSWWRGEGNAIDSVGGNNGSLVGGVTFAAGDVGRAFNFSGPNDVTVASTPTLNLTTAVTLESWIKPSTLAFNNNFGAIIAKSSGTTRDYGLFLKSNGALHLSYFNASGTNVFLETAPNLVPVGQFSHVAGVIGTATGVMQIYLNGNLVASRATSGPMVANSVPLAIGLSDPGLNYGFKGLIDEPSVYNRALSQGEIQSIVNDGGAGKTLPVVVANVNPTPALGVGSGLATQVLTFTASATDPSPVDQAAGFAYSINWGDGSPTQSIAATAGNGSGISLTHVFTTAGTDTANLNATDKDGGTGSITSTFTVLAVTSANMQTVINQLGSITFQMTTDAQAQAVVSAVNGLAAQATPVTITLNLGAANYTDLAPSPQAGITLVIVGSGGTTTVVGHSPALAVAGGDVVIEDLTLVTETDSPTVTVSGGNLTLRNVSVQGNGTGSRPAVAITGGTVDLGTADDPGGNTFNANGPGELIHNAGANGVSAVGDTFQVGGAALSSPYRIKDRIFDALNVGGGGLVTYVPGNAYISVNGGDIQRGVDAIAEGGTVNVEAGSYKQYDAGSKLVTIRFEGGPTLSQQADPDGPGLRELVVTGTAGADHIQFTPGGGGVQAQVQGVPNGRFAPTGRLVAYGLAGDDDIEVAGGIALPAFLFGGDGNDRLMGGGGNSVLVGGAGDDTLIGGRGQNLLIGGSGADALIAGSGDDLLIAGTTAYDANDAALAAIMAEWTSGRSYASRVANLSGTGSGPRNNGNDFLIASGPDATAFDDDSVDVLSGGSGTDWFFANRSGGVAQDLINDLSRGEIVEELDVQAP